MRRGKTDAYPAFPEIKAQRGYNPARFLVPTDSDRDELSWTTRVKAFIRSMDDVETIHAWQTVEVALGQGPNGGPRKKVIKWLNRRKAVLDGTDTPAAEPEHRESSHDETTETIGKPDQPTPSDTAVSLETALATDGGAQSAETARCPVCQTELIEEEIADKIGYWCPPCGEFRDSAITEVAP